LRGQKHRLVETNAGENTMSIGKRAAAEFFGTFWLVFGGAEVPFWRRHFRQASLAPGT